MIGNSAYDNPAWHALNNAASDADLIAARLRAIGFAPDDVVEVTNANHQTMEDTLRNFAVKARGADLVLIYYSGHGAAIGPGVWMIPRDADAPTNLDASTVELQAISVDTITRVARTGSVGLVLIDACREIVGRDSAGGEARGALTPMTIDRTRVPKGVIVQMSTEEGMPAYDGKGDHSVYAKALDIYLQNADAPLHDVLENVEKYVAANSNPQQFPSRIKNELTDDAITLNLQVPAADALKAKVEHDLKAADDERSWRIALAARSRAGYLTYQQELPNGVHFNEAQDAIEALRVQNTAHFEGTIDEARRALTAVNEAEWRTEQPEVLAAKVIQKTNSVAIRKLADANDDRALVILAALLDDGLGGLPQDHGTALLFYQRASAHSNPTAERILGDFARYGRGGKAAQLSEAGRLYELAAKAGDARAQDSLGSMYADGLLGPALKTKAAAFYQMAADQGDAWAECHVASAYSEGVLGVKVDDKKALTYAQASADQGNYCGELTRGHMYLYGLHGSPKDEARSAALYKQAADQGYAAPQLAMGLLYASGRGVPRDLKKAVAYFRDAAGQGYAQAQFILGAAYVSGSDGLPKDLTEAVKNFALAAGQNFPAAQAAMGWAYSAGVGGLARDDTEAVRLLRLAVESNDADGQFRLGYMNAEGRGVAAKNTGEAKRLMRLSAAQGNPAAARWLKAQ